MFSRCPKCGHRPLPQDQSLPAACPSCGVILAKMAQSIQGRPDPRHTVVPVETAEASRADDDAGLRGFAHLLFHVPERVDAIRFWFRVALLAGFSGWGLRLIWMDYRNGEMGQSFLHGPLLIFHEAGHVVFLPFGEWLMVLGGTLGQLLMPAVLASALLWKNRDPFGAAIGLWLLGVSLLDVAPYMYDALHPQLMLLSGSTGEEGGHDWIRLFSSMGLLNQAQSIGAATHKLGALTVLLALGWAAWVLKLQHGRVAGDVLHEECEAAGFKDQRRIR